MEQRFDQKLAVVADAAAEPGDGLLSVKHRDTK